jgi:predicted ATPase
VLVGRRAELGMIERALCAVEDGAGRVVQLAGEPGIGKTRLLSELCTKAEKRHHLVLAGRAAEFESDLPFGLFVDALDDYIGDLNPDSHVMTKLARELSAIFPSYAPSGQTWAGLQVERYRIYRAMRAVLETLGGSRPVVLALDDMHWADPASVELLCYLLAHFPKAALLLAVAFRPAQTPPQLAAALQAAARNGVAERLELTTLSLPQAAQLLGEDLGRTTVEQLYQQSGGNPFYLEQLARAARHHNTGAGSPPGWDRGDIPGPIRAALTDELRMQRGRCFKERPWWGILSNSSWPRWRHR